MNELKDLFDTLLAEPGRDRLDLDAAVRRGRRRRAARTGAVLASTAVAVGLAAALVVSALPRHGDQLPSAPPASSTPVRTSSELVGSWVATELYGHDVSELLAPATAGGAAVMVPSVEFVDADGSWTWHSTDFCNVTSGPYTVTSGVYRARQTKWSQALCPLPRSSALERAGGLNLQALIEADEARFAHDPATGVEDLVLLKGGEEIARYRGRSGEQAARAYLQDSPELLSGLREYSEPVSDPAELVGRWLAVQVGGHDVTDLAERNRRVEFAADEDGGYGWSGTDGCNGWDGTYAVTDGRFRVPTKGSTFAYCTTVNVPAAATILALTTADQVRFTYDLKAGQTPDTPEFVLLQDGRVLARFVQVS